MGLMRPDALIRHGSLLALIQWWCRTKDFLVLFSKESLVETTDIHLVVIH